jgi:hypothetical protein
MLASEYYQAEQLRYVYLLLEAYEDLLSGDDIADATEYAREQFTQNKSPVPRWQPQQPPSTDARVP